MTSSKTTRRAAIVIMAAAAIAPRIAIAGSNADADLIALGKRYEPLLRQAIDVHVEWGPLLTDAHRRVEEEVGPIDRANGYWTDEHSKALSKFTAENGCDAVMDRQEILLDAMYPIEDAILEADCKTLEGLRAKGLVHLRHILPGCSDEWEFDFESGDFERSLFYAVADLTGIRALADATEAKLAAAHKAEVRS